MSLGTRATCSTQNILSQTSSGRAALRVQSIYRRKTAVGIEGRSNLRNTPTLLNVAFNKFLFHDAREFSLENQVWQPVLAHSEMAMPSFGFTIKKLELIPGYKKLFNDAFPEEGITMETFGKAIASYERALVSGNSAFDKWFYGGNEAVSYTHLTLPTNREV